MKQQWIYVYSAHMLITGVTIAILVHCEQIKSMCAPPIRRRLRDRRASAATADTRRGSDGSEVAREGQIDLQSANQRSSAASTTTVRQMCSTLAKSWLTWVVVMVAVLIGVSLVSAYIPIRYSSSY
jgi:hypothetical protein